MWKFIWFSLIAIIKDFSNLHSSCRFHWQVPLNLWFMTQDDWNWLPKLSLLRSCWPKRLPSGRAVAVPAYLASHGTDVAMSVGITICSAQRMTSSQCKLPKGSGKSANERIRFIHLLLITVSESLRASDDPVRKKTSWETAASPWHHRKASLDLKPVRSVFTAS